MREDKDEEEGGGRREGRRRQEGGGHLCGLALPLGFHPLPLDLLQFQIMLQIKETQPLCWPRSPPTPSSLRGVPPVSEWETSHVSLGLGFGLAQGVLSDFRTPLLQ